MADITKDQILDALKRVRGPDLEGDIVSQGLVSDIFAKDGKVIFSITVPAERAQELEPLREAAEKVVSELPGVASVMVALTAEKKPGQAAAPSGSRVARSRTRSTPSSSPRPPTIWNVAR